MKGFPADVLPLLVAGLFSGSSDGDSVRGGVQGGPTGPSLPRALHAAATPYYGLCQGDINITLLINQ